MRKKQCKECDDISLGNSGEVIQKVTTKGFLPGCQDQIFPIRIYTVKCCKCHRQWKYRKKIK